MRPFIVLIAAIMLCNEVRACDMCGGGSSGQYIGLLPAFSRNFAGLQYSHAAFHGSFPSAYSGRPNERTTDHYNTLQAWGRQRIGSRYQVFAFVPYQYNVRYKDGIRRQTSGLSDITVLATRILLDRHTGPWQHMAFAGLGAKLPTGAYANNNGTSADAAPALSPGTGSWDALLTANYTLRKGRAGVNLEGGYTIATPSPDKYRYGNKLNADLTALYTANAGRWTLMPQAGARYEYAAADLYNYERGWVNDYSGGQRLYGLFGLQVARGSCGLRLAGLLPVSQHYAGGEITARYKTETTFFILF